MESKADILKELVLHKNFGAGLLNSVEVLGEKLSVSTGPEGINAIAADIEELNTAFNTFYDGLSSSEREMQSKILRFVTANAKIQN